MSVQAGGVCLFFPHNSRTICGKEPSGHPLGGGASPHQRRLDVQHGRLGLPVPGLVPRLESRRPFFGQNGEMRPAERVPAETLEVQTESLDHRTKLVAQDGPLIQRLPLFVEHEGIGRRLDGLERLVLLDQNAHRQVTAGTPRLGIALLASVVAFADFDDAAVQI